MKPCGTIFLSFFLLAGCNFRIEKNAVRKTIVADETPTFRSFKENILEPKCLVCHAGENSQSGIDLTTYESVINNGEIKPGNPEESRLYELVRDGKMPPPKRMPPLSDNERQFVYLWIKKGALK